ncbi:MAG: type II toxin-antitoxin system HicB family antitoxin [Patescibacteria group bacterium]
MKNKKEIIYQYEVIFDSNGQGYTVTVPKLPGLVTEGDNLQEAREMAKDAIRCYLEALLKDRVLHSQPLSKRERIKMAV